MKKISKAIVLSYFLDFSKYLKTFDMNLFILAYLMKYFHKSIYLILILYQNPLMPILDNKYSQILKF